MGNEGVSDGGLGVSSSDGQQIRTLVYVPRLLVIERVMQGRLTRPYFLCPNDRRSEIYDCVSCVSE